MPLPVANGSAAVPSVVDVYVNNALQAQQRGRDPGRSSSATCRCRRAAAPSSSSFATCSAAKSCPSRAITPRPACSGRACTIFPTRPASCARRSARRATDMAPSLPRPRTATAFPIGSPAKRPSRPADRCRWPASRPRQWSSISPRSAARWRSAIRGAAPAFAPRRRSSGARPDSPSACLPTMPAPPLRRSAGTAPGRCPATRFRPLPTCPGRAARSASNLLHRSLRGEPDETLIGLFGSWRISESCAAPGLCAPYDHRRTADELRRASLDRAGRAAQRLGERRRQPPRACRHPLLSARSAGRPRRRLSRHGARRRGRRRGGGLCRAISRSPR